MLPPPQPDFWSLYIYIAVVNAAAFALARFRMWLWLAIAAIVLGALWTLPGTQADAVTALGAHVFHALAGFALVATFLVCGLVYGPPAAPGMIDRLSTLALVVYLLAAAFLVLASRHDPVALTAFVVLTVATVAIAWRTEAAAGAVPAAAILAALVMAHWAVHMNVQGLLAPSGPAAPAIPEPERYDYGSHLMLAAGWAVLFGAGGFLAQGRSSRALVPMLWSAAAVFAPLAMLVALYYRIAQLDRSLPFAALALLVAAIFGLATETLAKREPRPGVMAASAMFATGTLGALALALTFALEKGWLTIALALTVPGIAWVVEQRPLPWLRWLAAIMVAVVAARVAYQPTIAGADLGTTPVFNWLLYGYGVPAAAFWIAGLAVAAARRRSAGAHGRCRRHPVHGAARDPGDPPLRHRRRHLPAHERRRRSHALRQCRPGDDHRARTRARAHRQHRAQCRGAVDRGTDLDRDPGRSRVRRAPYFHSIPVGGAFFNLVLLGYGLPAVLAITLALIARTTRPISYRVAATIAAVTLALFYLTLEVRRLFHGPVLDGSTSDAEQYAYSTVWLAFGIVLLAVGFFLRSQPARLTALAVIALTIAKVFIIDTASISGIYRALSVIGLGVVLLGIGWVYQHVLYPRARSEEAS